jgi:hypothetical protein
MRGILIWGAGCLGFFLGFMAYLTVVGLILFSLFRPWLEEGSALYNIILAIVTCGAFIVPGIISYLAAAKVEAATEPPPNPTYTAQRYTTQVQQEAQAAMRRASEDYLNRVRDVTRKY